MLPEVYTREDLLNEIHEDCKHLLDYCCNFDIADVLHNKYSELRSKFKEFNTPLGIRLAIDCTEILIALERVMRHGDIISVSYDNNLVTVLYADGLVSSILTILAHYYSLENPECTFVDMEDPSTDKGFRVLITNDEYIAFTFCCNCYCKISENIRNLSNLILLTEDHLLNIAEHPTTYSNKYGLYTDSEYYFTSTL